MNIYCEIDYQMKGFKENFKSNFEKLQVFEVDLRLKDAGIWIKNLFSAIRIS